MKTNYTQFTKEQLEEKIKELLFRIMQSYPIKQEEKKANRTKLRKEIARIKTELNKRK